jgi:methionine synthase II (cobalamin-independent)
MVCIPRVRHEALMAAARALKTVIRDLRDAGSASFIKPLILAEALEADSALRAANIQTEEEHR